MTRLALPILRPVDGSGNPFPSGTLNFYDAGASTTPKTVYSDSALSVSLGSVVTADGEGLFTDVYYSGDIRFVLKDKNGVVKSTKDIYGAGNIGTGDIVDLAVTTAKIADNAVTLGKLFVLDDTKIITSNGVANSQVALSGDITMTNTGVTSIGTSKVTAAKIASDAVTTPKIMDGTVTEPKLTTALQNWKNSMYFGAVANSGVPAWSGTAVTGFTLSLTSTGVVRVTHNFASTDYFVVAMARANTGVVICAQEVTHNANYFEIETQPTNTVAAADHDFNFFLKKTV